MGLTILSRGDVGRILATKLRLQGGESHLPTIEGAAAMLRHAAELDCPCTARTLVKRAEGMVAGLLDLEQFPEPLSDVLDRLVGIGDLVAIGFSDAGGPLGTAGIGLGPPRYVRIAGSAILLLGVEPDGQSLLPEAVWNQVSLRGELRILRSPQDSAIEQQLLRAAGYVPVSSEAYANIPSIVLPEEVRKETDRRLMAASLVGELNGVEVILPHAPEGYYKGRWGPPGKLTGKVIARRPQNFGSALWCYIEFVNGKPRRMIDLGSQTWRGCDEAWRLLMATDAVEGRPQRFRISRGPVSDVVRVDLFTPLPRWCQRFIALVSVPAPVGRGALLSFEVRDNDLAGVVKFLERNCWMVES